MQNEFYYEIYLAKYWQIIGMHKSRCLSVLIDYDQNNECWKVQISEKLSFNLFWVMETQNRINYSRWQIKHNSKFFKKVLRNNLFFGGFIHFNDDCSAQLVQCCQLKASLLENINLKSIESLNI